MTSKRTRPGNSRRTGHAKNPGKGNYPHPLMPGGDPPATRSGAAAGNRNGQIHYGSQREQAIPAAQDAKEVQGLVLRWNTPPVDQLDFNDRHETRATQSDEALRRYTARDQDRQRRKWNELAMDLVWLAALLIGFVILVVVYVAGTVALSTLLTLGPARAAQIVGLAYFAAGGSIAVRGAGRALKKHYVQRSSHRPGSTEADPESR